MSTFVLQKGFAKTLLLCHVHRLLDQETAVYILTLGVAEGHRQLGIASRLIQLVVAHAQWQLSRAVYLHVIEYNTAALRFYQKNGFEELTTLRNFYYIG